MLTRFTYLCLLVGAAVALTPASAEVTSRADADSMAAKIARIREAVASPRASTAPPRYTSFTDREANAYLRLQGPTFLPPGIADPRITTGPKGKVTARAIVDLDAVRQSRRRSLLDPLAFVTGALEVVATGIVTGTGGMGVARFESARLGGVPVPRSVAQELVRFYTRAPGRPEGFAFDTPMELPAGIRSVTIEPGRVTLGQ